MVATTTAKRGSALSRWGLHVLTKCNRENRVILLGTKGSGRKSIFYSLKYGQVVHSNPVEGLKVIQTDYDSMTITLWDDGDKESIKDLFLDYCSGSQGLIFVVNSTEQESIDAVKKDLSRLLSLEGMADAKILVFCNRQDVPGAQHPSVISQQLGLYELKRTKWKVQPCVAEEGTGVAKGFRWLSNALNENGINPVVAKS